MWVYLWLRQWYNGGCNCGKGIYTTYTYLCGCTLQLRYWYNGGCMCVRDNDTTYTYYGDVFFRRQRTRAKPIWYRCKSQGAMKETMQLRRSVRSYLLASGLHPFLRYRKPFIHETTLNKISDYYDFAMNTWFHLKPWKKSHRIECFLDDVGFREWTK